MFLEDVLEVLLANPGWFCKLKLAWKLPWRRPDSGLCEPRHVLQAVLLITTLYAGFLSSVVLFAVCCTVGWNWQTCQEGGLVNVEHTLVLTSSKTCAVCCILLASSGRWWICPLGIEVQ